MKEEKERKQLKMYDKRRSRMKKSTNLKKAIKKERKWRNWKETNTNDKINKEEMISNEEK